MQKNTHEHLFRPCRIGRHTMKNRIVMSPLTRCRADDEHVPTAMMAEYYGSRASMGLLITESVMVEAGYSAMAYEPGIYSAAQVAAWRRVTEAVHARGGLIVAQIYHGGRATVAANLTAPGLVPVGASPIAIPATAERCMAAWSRDGVEQPFAPVVREMGVGEIARMVRTFARAARNCVAAGFDFVEIHAGTGFLIDQFLRDGSNRRTDGYGGGVEGRARFLLEVVDAVAAAIEPDRVGVRLTPLDSTNGQSDTQPEALLRYVCDQLDRRRVAFIDLFRGDPKAREVARTELVARAAFGGTILASHGYADAAAAERAVAEGAVDAVCFGLPAVSNPDLVWRILRGVPLNRADDRTLYTRGPEGYIDYPICEPSGCLQPSFLEGVAVANNDATVAVTAPPAVAAPARARPFFAVSQPLLIGTASMKNRLVMGPLARQRCDAENCATAAMVDYYARRAGYGLQVSDPCEVQPGYHTYVRGAAVSTRAQVLAWRRVTTAVHNAGGLIFCQLHHGGRAVLPCNIAKQSDGRVVGPTSQAIRPSVLCPAAFAASGEAQPYAQEVSELRPATLAWVVKLFATAAKNAMLAGFDGVEIHAGGGYLIDTFLRSCSNTRTDEYGGSIANRCRLLDQVVDAVVAVVGKARVGVRLSPTDLSKGMTAQDAEAMTRVVGARLGQRKVAYVVLASGSDGLFHGPVPVRVLQALRQHYAGVVLCDDNISLAEAELRVKEDTVQAVCMTLSAIANPDIMERAIHGVAIEEADLHTLCTHDAAGYDTYPTYAELRRQLREAQAREWAANEANYATEGREWLPEQRASIARRAQNRSSSPRKENDAAAAAALTHPPLAPKRSGACGGGYTTPFTSQQRERRGSSASSIFARNNSNGASTNAVNDASSVRASASGKVGRGAAAGLFVPYGGGSESRQRDRNVSFDTERDFAWQPSPMRQAREPIFVPRDSRMSRRQSIT